MINRSGKCQFGCENHLPNIHLVSNGITLCSIDYTVSSFGKQQFQINSELWGVKIQLVLGAGMGATPILEGGKGHFYLWNKYSKLYTSFLHIDGLI